MTEIIVDYNPNTKIYQYSNALAKLEITLTKAGIAALKGKAAKAEKLVQKAARQMGKCYEVGEAVGMSHDSIQALFDEVCANAQYEINCWAAKHCKGDSAKIGLESDSAKIGIESVVVKRRIEF